jgi:hypothetical protein
MEKLTGHRAMVHHDCSAEREGDAAKFALAV